MKLNIIKFLSAIIVVAFIGFMINGCKKNNTDTAINKKEAEDYKAKAIAATIERYGKITAPVIFQANKPASSVSYIDRNGQLIQFAGTQSRTNSGSCGQYDCSNTINPSDLYVTYTLDQVKWYYECGGGHDLTAIWKVSTPYSILAQDPNSSTYSYGNIRITQGGFTLATSSNLGNGNLVIVNLGTDPNCYANTLYTVTYTWQNISDTYFPGNYVDCSLNLYNDCALVSNINVVGWTNGIPYTNTLDIFSIPCDRVDQAFITPASSGQTYTTVTGAYSTCSPPFGFTGTDYHQVEYREVTPLTNNGSLLWGAQTSTIHGGVAVGTSTPEIPVIDAYGGTVIKCVLMTVSSGAWLVRYRNRHTGCAPNSPSDPPIGGSWDNTSGNNNYVTEYLNL